MSEQRTTTVYLLRHGETDWGQDHNRYCGRTDIPLNQLGREQARRAASALRALPIAAAYTSPLSRAVSTARLIVEPHGLDVIAIEGLIEIDFGEWEGMRRSDIARRDANHWAQWLNNPGETQAGRSGETALDAVTRAETFVHRLRIQHPGETVLVVAHNTLNRLVIASSLGMELFKYRVLTQNNCGISVAEISADATRWLTINETAHLRD